jgi:hypothetical protein
MDWTQIALAVIGLIGAVDLVRLLFIKEERKGKQVETKDKEIETLRKTNDLLESQVERNHETIMKLTEENNALHGEKADLLATQACLFDDMCIHKGCRLRKPHPGQGMTWYNAYREDPALGADYLSIDTLMKQERAARNTKEED